MPVMTKTLLKRLRRAKAERQRKYRQKIRIETIEAYGGKCVDCGSSKIDELEMDHENGHGNEHRNEIFGAGHTSPGGWNFFLKLRQMGYPQDLGLVLRCTDCHDKKHPHRGNPFGRKRRKARR